MKGVFFIFCFLMLFSKSFAQSSEFEKLLDNQEIIWDMQWVGQDSIMFTELKGKLKLLDVSSKTVTDIYDFQNLAAENQAGLMGLQLAHDFATSRKVYVAYTFYDLNFVIFSRISSFEYNIINATLANEKILVDSLPSRNANLGGRLLLDSNYIYYTSGDIQNENLAQLLDNPNGKILRYNLDGSTPIDNPITSSPIYSFGHRNPQGICKTANGKIVISEHGPFSNDEINVLEIGRNFGWPLVGGFKEPANEALYNQFNIVEPIAAFTPTIAPAGIDFYSNTLYPSLSNSLLVATLKDNAIYVLKMNLNQDSVLSTTRLGLEPLGRIRDVLISPDGRVFAATSNKDFYGEPKDGDDIIFEIFEGFWTSTKNLYPNNIKINSTNNGFSVSSNSQELINYKLYSIAGKLVSQDNLNNNQKVVFQNLVSGIYILEVAQGQFKTSKKFVFH